MNCSQLSFIPPACLLIHLISPAVLLYLLSLPPPRPVSAVIPPCLNSSPVFPIPPTLCSPAFSRPCHLIHSFQDSPHPAATLLGVFATFSITFLCC